MQLKNSSLKCWLCFIFAADIKTKVRLISNFMTSQPEKQTIPIHILPNSSISIGKQTMKFGQLIEYKKNNTFLKTSYTKWGVETIFRPFS